MFKSPRPIYPAICFFFLFSSLLTSAGCDKIYRYLHPEGAEELDLLGNISPLESNAKLAIVQKLLKLYGYRVGNPDGVLGPNTREAIGKFQADAGLNVTKFMDGATWDKLSEFIDAGLVVNGELNYILIQNALNKAGFDVGKADGRVGKKTKEAIMAFQKKQKLAADGRIGYKTLQAFLPYCPSASQK